MSENTKEKELSVKRSMGTNLVIISGVISIALGFVLMLLPQVTILTIAYALSGILVVIGIICIVRYFMSASYKNIGEYGFSFGVLFVVLGMCALIRAERISGYFVLCMGILLVFSAIIKLQNALDLKYLDDRSWIAVLIVAIAVMICAVIVIMNPFSNQTDVQNFTYIMLIADGALSLFCNLYLSMSIKSYDKRQRRSQARTVREAEEVKRTFGSMQTESMMEDEGTDSQSSSDAKENEVRTENVEERTEEQNESEE